MPKLILLALTLLALASGNAHSQAPATPPSNTLACTLTLPKDMTCYYERTNLQLLGLELATGAEIRFNPASDELLAFTPYTLAAYYLDGFALVGELRLPVLGSQPWLRLTTVLSW